MLRIFLVFILFLSLTVLPAWITLVLVLIFAYRFENPFEIIILGAAIDIFYTAGKGVYHVSYWYTLLVFTLYMMSTFLKTNLRK